ncbi:MAG: MBL fold metallo-hydrolase [Thermoplasmatales archaeon]
MKFTNNVDLIDGTIANCYVVSVNGKNILIDAGMKGAAKKIINYFEAIKGKPDVVLITHCHVDHIGGLLELENKFHPQIFVPDKEVEIAKGNEKMPLRRGIMPAIVGLSRAPPVPSARPMSEFNLPGLQIVDTNGHTPGSTSFYFENLGAIMVGDAVIEKNGKYEFNRSFTLDPERAELSIKKILEFHGVTAYPGHGKPFAIP